MYIRHRALWNVMACGINAGYPKVLSPGFSPQDSAPPARPQMPSKNSCQKMLSKSQHGGPPAPQMDPGIVPKSKKCECGAALGSPKPQNPPSSSKLERVRSP